jgi:hypothetical protein
LIAVSGSPVGLGERGWQTPPPAREKTLYRSRTEPLAGLLQFGRVTASAEFVVQRFIANADSLQLALRPMPILPEPD